MREMERHVMIFNVIAPVYNWFFTRQVRTYRSLIAQNERLFQLPTVGRVLDIGCGTGAFLFCLSENGVRTSGLPMKLRRRRTATTSN